MSGFLSLAGGAVAIEVQAMPGDAIACALFQGRLIGFQRTALQGEDCAAAPAVEVVAVASQGRLIMNTPLLSLIALAHQVMGF